ncbi:transcription factor MYBS3-like protein [Tanacetum coccineum]
MPYNSTTYIGSILKCLNALLLCSVVPWTGEEHRMFLLGLQKLRKSDWRGIEKNYVPTRKPTQVAGHAKKNTLSGKSNISRRKRRSSLFDIVADDYADTHMNSSTTRRPYPTLEEELEECESMDSSNKVDVPVYHTHVPLDGSQLLYPVMFLAYVSPLIPVSIPYWHGPGSSQDQSSSGKTESHEVLKPTDIHSKSLINVADVVGMSKLN